MALAKRTLIFVIVGALVLIFGLGGGIYLGLKFFSQQEPVAAEQEVANPGPMMELGQFTANLADPETHIVKLKLTLELTSSKVNERLIDPGWGVRLKDEVLRTLKNQRYDSIRYAEGMEMLKQDLRTRLNAMLPKVDGKVAIHKVLIDEFLVQ